MNKSWKIGLLLVCSLLIQGFAQNCPNVPRIPSYLGKGYDIVYGNPSTNIIDPGFRYEVIAFDYNTNTRTEDGKFLLPDGISFQKSQSCSYSSLVNEFRGTRSYQEELKVNVKVGGGYSGPAVQASFTASVGYRNMQQKIEKEQTVIFQASSRCQSYKIALDKFKPYKVSSSFNQAVQMSLRTNDWSAFISQYGTHYVTQVLFGGRAIQESQFTRTGVATLKERGVDIGLAIRASYAGFYGQASTQTSTTTQQQSQMESMRTKTSNYYIGGVPPGKGNIQDWQVQVNSQPMPISYEVSPLSDLFAQVPGKDTNWFIQARTSFYKALDAYCVGRCNIPTPDKPLPVKKCNLYRSGSLLYGGGGGSAFAWNFAQAGWHVARVNIRSGSLIDSFQVSVANGDNRNDFRDSGIYGGRGGSPNTFFVAPGDFITKIQVRAGSLIDGLTFFTKRGERKQYGGNGGSLSEVRAPSENYRLIGIFGKSGSLLDAIGFVWAENVCTISHSHLMVTELQFHK